MPLLKRAARREVLADALLHELLAGDVRPTTAPNRLRGWVDAITSTADELATVWNTHRDALTREATEAAFVPWGAIVFDRATDTAVSRKARTTWSTRFHHERGY